MDNKTKNIITSVLIVVLLLGIASGAFYLCYIPSVDIALGGANEPCTDTINLEIGDSRLLSPIYPDKIYLNKKVTFESSDNNIVSVDANGEIKAKKVGSVKITMTTVLFKKQSSVTINVAYGEPDKVDVDIVKNPKQYVGNAMESVEFKATTTRFGEFSQDPNFVKFKWTVFDCSSGTEIELSSAITKENTFSYTPENKYQKIKVVCTLIYNDKEKTGVDSTQIFYVFNKISASAFNIELTGNSIVVPAGSTIEMGTTLGLNVVFNPNSKVDESLVPTWKYVVSGVEKSTANTLLLDNFGEYTIKAILQEEDRVVTKEIKINTKYAEVSEVVFDKNKLSQPSDHVSPFILTAKWNKYANPTQTVQFKMLGRDSLNNGKEYSVEVGGNGSVSINVGVERTGDKLDFYINDVKTDIVMDMNNQYPIKIQASIGGVKSEYFTYVIASKEVENLKIFASLDGNFDSSKVNIKPISDGVVGGNRYNERVYIGAKTYPYDSYTDVKWYVNGTRYSSISNQIDIMCQDVGEYHIYCTNDTGTIKSNTLVIPSTAKSVPSTHFNYLGDYNGRTVNTYITSQSDIDSLLEYCILNDGFNQATTLNIFVDTSLQDVWARVYPVEDIYKGERFWIAIGNDYYYVDSNGNRTTTVPNSAFLDRDKGGMLSRAFYRVSYSGNFSTTDINSRFINCSRNVQINAPTDEPNKISGQSPYPQLKRVEGPFGSNKYIEANFEHNKVNATRHFAIDEIEQTKVVSTSSELFDAVENGYKPICKPNSNAEKIYLEARKVLSTYLTDNSTNEEKVRLINDWIVYFVTYDYKVTELKDLTINESMEYSAFYLDGVFSFMGKTNTGSAVNFTNRIAVCDGRSKAFTLMCAIEGIRSVRVTGECFKDSAHTQSAGGHAWNKVYIATKYNKNPQWYVVDTTWNDLRGGDKHSGYFEYQVDDFYLVTDEKHNNVKNMYCVEDRSINPYPKAYTEYTTFSLVA